MNEYRLRYIASLRKKDSFINGNKIVIVKGATMPTVKEELIFAKTDKSAIRKARFLVRQASKKIWLVHAVLEKIESKCIAAGEEIGEKI